MANHNGAAFIGDALKTAMTQTLRAIEILVIDDASTDASRAIVADLAQRDRRIRLIELPVRSGPAVARNTGLDQANARWIAVMDSDDLIHPERLERLLRHAEAQDTDIAADNLLVFDADTAVPPYAFLGEAPPCAIDLAAYVLGNAFGPARRKLGYLKPLFRTGCVRASGARYDPALRVAEDFSFVRALLAAGARFHIFSGLTYFYRKHPHSVSHRLAPGDITAMMDDDDRFLAAQPAPQPPLQHAFAMRRQGFRTALDFAGLIDAIKAGRWMEAASRAARHPRAALMLRQPVAARLGRRSTAERDPRRRICIITRRPVTADALAILAPLMTLGAMLAAAGDIHLVIPSSVRTAQRVALSQVPGMRAFKTVDMRSGPSVPPPPGESWNTDEALFIARYARPFADVIVADWLPGIDSLPFVLRPDALSLVLVDGLPPHAGSPAYASELAKLARAGAILAVREADAAVLKRACRATPIVLLPGGAVIAKPPGPLAPALTAFLSAVWPAAR